MKGLWYIGCVGGVALCPTLAGAVVFGLEVQGATDLTDLAIGDSFTLDLVVTTEGTEEITGFQIDLSFPTASIEYLTTTFNPDFGFSATGLDAVEDMGTTTIPNITAGLLPIPGLVEPITGTDIVLASFSLEAIGPADMGLIAITGAGGGDLLDGNNGDLPAAGSDSLLFSVAMPPEIVPLPASGLLLISVLPCLALLRRRRADV